jgi:hypothetical protein
MVKRGKGKNEPKNALSTLTTDVVVKDTIPAVQENDIDSDSPIGGGSNSRKVGPGLMVDKGLAILNGGGDMGPGQPKPSSKTYSGALAQDLSPLPIWSSLHEVRTRMTNHTQSKS